MSLIQRLAIVVLSSPVTLLFARIVVWVGTDKWEPLSLGAAVMLGFLAPAVCGGGMIVWAAEK